MPYDFNSFKFLENVNLSLVIESRSMDASQRDTRKVLEMMKMCAILL